jgi:lipopolysaccharide/colanic/teichoic acid biosynthesis glycosyltransferase
MPPPSVRFVKRTIDIVASTVGLAATLPFYPLIACAIRFESPGPVIFRQRRAKSLLPGSELVPGRPPACTEFTILKFRTMRQDAEKKSGAVFAEKNDPRATRVGLWLRKTRIDELPQLWNVLKGDMSLVGPRPERPELLANLALAIPFFEERMRDIKPGLTGMAQVHLGYTGGIGDDNPLAPFRGTLENPFQVAGAEGAVADDLRAKLLYDLAYSVSLERFGMFLRTELAILLRTPLVMLRASGQ